MDTNMLHLTCICSQDLHAWAWKLSWYLMLAWGAAATVRSSTTDGVWEKHLRIFFYILRYYFCDHTRTCPARERWATNYCHVIFATDLLNYDMYIMLYKYRHALVLKTDAQGHNDAHMRHTCAVVHNLHAWTCYKCAAINYTSVY